MANILREQLVLELRSARVGCESMVPGEIAPAGVGTGETGTNPMGPRSKISSRSSLRASARGIAPMPQIDDPNAVDVDASFISPLTSSKSSCTFQAWTGVSHPSLTDAFRPRLCV